MIGYARSPSAPQVVREAQELRKLGCVEVFTDKRRGTSAFLLGLEQATAAVAPGEALVVLRLEALGHDVRDLARFAIALEQDGKHLVSVGDELDTRRDGPGFFAAMRMLARLQQQAEAERHARPARREPATPAADDDA
jgi:DNA invertase Pin-like site-specific DNA recombinase